MINLLAVAGVKLLEGIIEKLEPDVVDNILTDLQSTSVTLSRFVGRHLIQGTKNDRQVDTKSYSKIP